MFTGGILENQGAARRIRMTANDNNISSPPELAVVFCDIGRALTSSLDPMEVFQRVMVVIGDYFSPRNWSLLLREKDGRRLRFEIVMGVEATRLKKVWVEEDEGIAGWVSRHGKPALVADVQDDPRFSARIDEILGFVTRSVVSVPLLNGDQQVIGVIELINKVGAGDDFFTPEDMAILSAIGVFAGIGAEKAFLHQRVKELAMTDPLTGLGNRLYFNDTFSREAGLVARYGHPLCLLMMDMDNMKAINDRHGHLVGDQALVALAELLRGEIRTSDTIARLGGDEFVIIMPQTDAEAGGKLSLRIEDAIARWNLAAPLGKVRLGLSIGVQAGGPDEVDSLLAAADSNLYRVKKSRKTSRRMSHDEQVRHYLWDALADDDADP